MVKNLTLTRNNIKLQYISRGKSYLTSEFWEIKLSINPFTKMVSESIQQVEPIVRPAIEPLPNYPQIFSPKLLMSSSRCVRCVEDSMSTRDKVKL